MAKDLVAGSPSNSIATKHGAKTPGLGRDKKAQSGKKVGSAHGPRGKKM